MKITFSIVKEVIIEAAKRVLKVDQYGPKTADQISSFGDDSSPIKNMVAVYAQTSVVGEDVIIGYINENQVAQPGEKRIFSLDSNGNLSTSIHLKGDNTMELAGAVDFAVRYQKLDDSLQEFKTKINAELVKIQSAGSGIGLVYAHVPVTINTSQAKIDEIKVP